MLFSCHKEDDNYEIINDFIKTNKIEISNLQADPFCLKELYLNSKEEQALNLKSNEDVLCSQKLNLQMIQGKQNDNSGTKCMISYPLYSKEKLHLYIIVSNYYINEINFYKQIVLYKLIKTKGHWKIVNSYETVTQT